MNQKVPPTGQLGSLDVSGFTPGTYSLRIVAIDQAGRTRDSWSNTSTRIRIDVISNIPQASLPDATYPTNNQLNVAINAPIIIHFPVKLNPNTVTPTSIQVQANGKFIAGTVQYNDFSQSVIFSPTTTLDPSSVHIVSISPEIQNIFGTPLGQNYIFQFKTTTYLPTLLTEVYPPSKQMDAGTKTPIIVAGVSPSAPFSSSMEIQPIVKTPIPTYTYKSYNASNYSAKYTNITTLLDKMIYIVTLKPTMLDQGYYSWYFVTEDNVLPAITGVDPVPNGLLALAGTVSAFFNKSMNGNSFTTNSFYIEDMAVPGIKIRGNIDYLLNEKKVLFTPTKPFMQGKTYRARLTTDLKDFGGKALAQTTNWIFTTPPPIASPSTVNPLNGSVSNIIKNMEIVARLTSGVDPETVNSSTFRVWASNGLQVAGNFDKNTNSILRFLPQGYLSQNTWYTCAISTNVIATNDTHLNTEYRWSFKTLPPIAASELVLSPEENSTNISLSASFQVIFPVALESGTVNAATFKAHYVTAGMTNTIPLDVFNPSNSTARLVPKILLPQDTEIQVFITSAVKTILGTSLATDHAWSFRTVSSMPGTVLLSPTNNSTNISLVSSIEATFLTNLNSTTINEQTFYVLWGNTNLVPGIRIYDNSLKKSSLPP